MLIRFISFCDAPPFSFFFVTELSRAVDEDPSVGINVAVQKENRTVFICMSQVRTQAALELRPSPFWDISVCW
jgi:hypothetical protein